MSLDISTLKLLKYRDRFERLAGHVPRQAVDPNTAILLDDFKAFFKEFPDVKRIDPGVFTLWFKGFRHPTLNPEAAEVFTRILSGLAEDVDPAVEQGLLARLVAAGAAYDTAKLIESFQNGDEVEFRMGLEAITDAYDAAMDRKVKNPQVLDRIEDLLEAEKDDTGLHFRLESVNRSIKPLVGGDFVIVAARPDAGKTTWIASEATFMAPQVDMIYPDEGRSILWLNNEGPGKRIITRNFQSAIGPDGSTLDDLIRLNVPSGTVHQSKIRDEYVKALGGRPGVLRVFDIHGFSNGEVENLIRKYNPALVIFDMVDNISFGGMAINNGQRTDQLLEAMYQWARLIGVKYDTAVIATSQVSADGEGVQWPAQSMLKDSKTGKQGAADMILMIGKSNEPQHADLRYLSTPKNKKGRTGMPRLQAVVQIDGDRARYKELPAA